MSEQLSNLSAADIAEFKTLLAEAIETFNQQYEKHEKFAKTLLVIKRRELWRADGHKNWTSFLDWFAEKLEKTRRHLFQIIREGETRFKLVKSLHQKSPNLSKIAEKMKPEAVREVSKIAEEERGAVIEIASKQMSGNAPSAPAIAAAAKVQKSDQKATDKSTWPHDSTPKGGCPIPPPAWPFWERRNEVQPDLNQISEIKCRIEKAKESGDSLYSWIGTPAIDALQNAFTTIANAKLYAVCTKCEGWWDRMTGGGCSTCHNTGLLSKHQYDVCSPKEIKEIREKSNRARA